MSSAYVIGIDFGTLRLDHKGYAFVISLRAFGHVHNRN